LRLEDSATTLGFDSLLYRPPSGGPSFGPITVAFRRSAVSAKPTPIMISASVALRLPGAMQLMQVPITDGASNMMHFPCLPHFMMGLRLLSQQSIFSSPIDSTEARRPNGALLYHSDRLYLAARLMKRENCGPCTSMVDTHMKANALQAVNAKMARPDGRRFQRAGHDKLL
jgi:hypothetical protein